MNRDNRELHAVESNLSISPTSRFVVVVPVTHTGTATFESAAMGMRMLVTTLGRLWSPAQVSFTVACDQNGMVTAAWQVVAADAEDAAAGAAMVTGVLAAVTPWLRLAEPSTPIPHSPSVSGAEQIFTAGPVTPTTVVSAVSPAWRYAATQRLACRFTVTLAGGLREPHPPAPLGTDPSAGAGELAPHLTCHVSLLCDDPRSDAMAALLCGDTWREQTLQVAPARPGRNLDGQLSELSVDLIGHLLATPVRIPAFRAAPAVTLTDALNGIRSTPARHLLLQGATGQGKTTFLTHLADHALAAGDTVVCVDVHDGDLAHQVAHAARRHHRNPMVVNLAATTFPPPRIALTRPPGEITADRWAQDLYGIIRDALWPDMPAEYFGPVNERALTILLSALIRDPQGPAPLTHLPRLISTVDSDYRIKLLTRIDDPDLTHAVLSEVMPMLSSKDPGNSAIWLTSKLDPLIGSGPVSRVVAARVNTVDIDAAIAEGRPVILHVPAGELGDSASRVLVSTLLHQLWLTIRARPADRARPRVELVLDEWQTYPLPALGRMLAEGRKFGVHLNLANQSLTQIPPRLLQTALANAGTVATFRTGPTDAHIIESRFRTLTSAHLQQLPRHRLAIAGEAEDLQLTPPPTEPVTT